MLPLDISATDMAAAYCRGIGDRDLEKLFRGLLKTGEKSLLTDAARFEVETRELEI